MAVCIMEMLWAGMSSGTGDFQIVPVLSEGASSSAHVPCGAHSFVACDASLLSLCFSVMHNSEVCSENRKRHWSLISLWARMEIGYLLFC